MTPGSLSRMDFLSRLADRALGTAPRVEPRLPALFETRSDGAGLLGIGWDTDAPSDTPGETVVSAPRPRAAAPQTLDEDGPPVPRRRRTGQPTEQPALIDPAPPRVAEWSVPRRPTPLALAPAPEAGGEATPVARPVTAAKDPIQTLSPRIDAPTRGRAPEGLVPLGRLEPEAPARSPNAAPLPARATAPLAPAVAAPVRREPRRPGPATPEPVINISIGRIDIRAHAEATAPVRPQSAPVREPVQSLEAYLKQRAAER